MLAYFVPARWREPASRDFVIHEGVIRDSNSTPVKSGSDFVRGSVRFTIAFIIHHESPLTTFE
jgi:hypothetical protein